MVQPALRWQQVTIIIISVVTSVIIFSVIIFNVIIITVIIFSVIISVIIFSVTSVIISVMVCFISIYSAGMTGPCMGPAPQSKESSKYDCINV